MWRGGMKQRQGREVSLFILELPAGFFFLTISKYYFIYAKLIKITKKKPTEKHEFEKPSMHHFIQVYF